MKIPKSAIVLLILWALVFVLAFIAPRLMVTQGDGFTRGLNRVGAFFLWQLGALCISILLAVVAWKNLKPRKGLKWAFSLPLLLHLALVILLIGVFVAANFRKPPNTYYEPPVTTTKAPVAEAAPLVAIPAIRPENASVNQEVETYMGIYKSGFEMSYFYTMDGQGPWWLDTTDEDHETLQSYFVERLGRGSGITVAMTVSAYLDDIDSELKYLAPTEKKIHIVSIESVRKLDLQEFDLILETIQK